MSRGGLGERPSASARPLFPLPRPRLDVDKNARRLGRLGLLVAGRPAVFVDGEGARVGPADDGVVRPS